MGYPECPKCGKRLVGYLDGIIDEGDIISGGEIIRRYALDCPECEARLVVAVCIGRMSYKIQEARP